MPCHAVKGRYRQKKPYLALGKIEDVVAAPTVMILRRMCFPVGLLPLSVNVFENIKNRFSHASPPSFIPFPIPISQNIRSLEGTLSRFSCHQKGVTSEPPRHAPSAILRLKLHAPLRASSTMAAWACEACTFSNEPGMTSCEICGTPSLRAPSARATTHTAWPSHATGSAKDSNRIVDIISDKQPAPSRNASQCERAEMLASETSDTALQSPSFAASFEGRLPPANVSPIERAAKRMRLKEATRGEDIRGRSGDRDTVQAPSSSNSLLAELHGERLSRRGSQTAKGTKYNEVR